MCPPLQIGVGTEKILLPTEESIAWMLTVPFSPLKTKDRCQWVLVGLVQCERSITFGKYKYTGNKEETETNLKDMSHPIRCLKVNGNDMLSCQSAAYQCVCERVLRRKAEPQIAFNWRLKLSDSLRLSCQSRRSHHGDASQRSAPLTTSGNGWLWRTVRERVDGRTSGRDDRDAGLTHKHIYRQMWGTQASTHTYRPEEGCTLRN